MSPGISAHVSIPLASIRLMCMGHVWQDDIDYSSNLGPRVEDVGFRV